MSFEIVASPALVDTNNKAAFGVLYQSGRDTAVCAKMIREDIKAAQKLGAFRGLKIAVSIKRFSMGSSVSVKITASDGPVMCEAYRARMDAGIHVDRMNCYTPRIARALRWLEIIVDQYRRDDSDPVSDYFSTNFYADQGVDIDLEIAESNRLARKGLVRVAACALEHLEAHGDVSDDRAELAIKAAQRGDELAALEVVPDDLGAGFGARFLALLGSVLCFDKHGDTACGGVVTAFACLMSDAMPGLWDRQSARQMLLGALVSV